MSSSCLCLSLAGSFVSPFSSSSLSSRFAFSFKVLLARGKHEVAFFYAYSFAKVLDFLVGPSGLEPPTSCLSGTRSNLLSYEPLSLVIHLVFGSIASYLAARPSGLVEMMGFEPMTPCLQGRCSPS